MQSTFISLSLVMALGASTAFASSSANPSFRFSVSHPVHVPGAVLEPGSYSIEVLDHLSDRTVVRINNSSHHEEATFLAIPGVEIQKPSTPGMISWQNAPGDTSYMRGWYFRSGASPWEFVYPKNDAVALAKVNDIQVPAIDPASEGRPDLRGLSKTDMELVTLWLLASTRVGPSDAQSISAERYKPAASVTHRRVIASLPHTASNLPYLWLLGLFSFASAIAIRMRRSIPVRRPLSGVQQLS